MSDPLYIYDPLTAEVLKPVDLLKDIEKLSDDDLAALIVASEELQTEIGKAVAQLRAVMFHRLDDEDATLRETPGFTLKLTAQRAYDYDLPQLLTLKSHLTGEQFEQAFKTTVTPNKTVLNKLVKLGGAIKQIIEASIREVDKPAKLEIVPKAPVVG